MDRTSQVHGEDTMGCSVAKETLTDLLRQEEGSVRLLRTSFAARNAQTWLRRRKDDPRGAPSKAT